MNKRVSLGVAVGGVLLMIFCISSPDSFGPAISRFFAGSPDHGAIRALIGGMVTSTVGVMAGVGGARRD
jgi:hypothetical protein